MAVLEFALDGVLVRFEAPRGASQGVAAKSGKVDDLVAKASKTLEEAACATAKMVQIFAAQLANISVSSLEVELGIKLEGQAGFLFVNSKAEAALTVKATLDRGANSPSA